jgi:hypothetical protein
MAKSPKSTLKPLVVPISVGGGDGNPRLLSQPLRPTTASPLLELAEQRVNPYGLTQIPYGLAQINV